MFLKPCIVFIYISDLSGQVLEKKYRRQDGSAIYREAGRRVYAKLGQQITILYEGMEAQKNSKLLQAFLREKYNQDIPVTNKVKNQKTILSETSFQDDLGQEGHLIYEKPIRIIVPKGEMRELNTITVTPSGKRSISVICNKHI